MYWPILMLALLAYVNLTQIIKSLVGEEVDLKYEQ
jgi:hypothetical protein